MESLITELVEIFGIVRGLAIVLMILIMGAGSSLVIMVGLVVRVRMHADHFDVNDRNIDRAKDLSMKALDVAIQATEQSHYTKGLMEGQSKPDG